MMRHSLLLGWLSFAASLLAAAGAYAQTKPASDTNPKVCRVDEKGARVVADRGLGGTGIDGSISLAPITGKVSAPATAIPQLADRGIGGTGISSHPKSLDDRGMGGTGIVGVITGFASVCLDGLEVNYNVDAAVNVDGSSESADVLRAGQLAVVEATNSGDELQANTLEIRHEVSGPVLDVENGGKLLIVSGQKVLVPDDIWGDSGIQRGDWIAVSGLRTQNGDIAATRIDRRLPGQILVRGTMTATPTGPQIGTLAVILPAGVAPQINQSVQVTGRYADGAIYVDSLVPDLFVNDPAAYFGPEVQQYVIDSYVEIDTGFVLFGGRRASIRHDFGGSAQHQGRAIMRLQKQKDGSLLATPLRTAAAPRNPSFGAHSTGDATSRNLPSFGTSPDNGARPLHHGFSAPNMPDAFGSNTGNSSFPSGMPIPGGTFGGPFSGNKSASPPGR